MRVSPSEAAGSTVYFLRTIRHYLHPLNRVFNIFLISFLLHATKLGIKISTKIPRYYVSSETQASALQQVEKFKYTLRWFSGVTESRTRSLIHGWVKHKGSSA